MRNILRYKIEHRNKFEEVIITLLAEFNTFNENTKRQKVPVEFILLLGIFSDFYSWLFTASRLYFVDTQTNFRSKRLQIFRLLTRLKIETYLSFSPLLARFFPQRNSFHRRGVCRNEPRRET